MRERVSECAAKASGGGFRMASGPSLRSAGTRRCLIGVSVIAICVVGPRWGMTSAGAATQTTVHGAATAANSCTVTVDPAVQPPGVSSVSVSVSSDASPEPHNGGAVTLSNTKLTVTIPSAVIQQAVDAGLVRDGFVIPSVYSAVLAASNTVEATHTYSVNTTETVHVINGVAQPLTATMTLPNATWHPIDGATPVVFTEHSLRVVQTIDLRLSIRVIVTQTFACMPSTVSAIVTLDAAHAPTIFAVRLMSCRYLHVGYNYFQAGIIVHWRVNQTGTGTLASGSYTTLGGGRTYHFLTMPLGVTLKPDSGSSHTHVRFSWTIGATAFAYAVTRDPGCVALSWTTPSTIQVGVPAHFASVDLCPAGTAGVVIAILGPGGGYGGLGGFPGYSVASDGSWSAEVTLPSDVGAPTTTAAYCESSVPNAPPLAVYETHPITITS